MRNKQVIRVRDVMTTDFNWVDGITTVATALRDMKNAAVRTLIVNKRHADDEFGMVLMSDIARLVLAKDRSPERVNIYEIMVKPVLTVPPEMDIRYCARLFDHYQVLRCPVVENGEVIGIVGFTNMVLRGMINGLE